MTIGGIECRALLPVRARSGAGPGSLAGPPAPAGTRNRISAGASRWTVSGARPLRSAASSGLSGSSLSEPRSRPGTSTSTLTTRPPSGGTCCGTGSQSPQKARPTGLTGTTTVRRSADAPEYDGEYDGMMSRISPFERGHRYRPSAPVGMGMVPRARACRRGRPAAPGTRADDDGHPGRDRLPTGGSPSSMRPPRRRPRSPAGPGRAGCRRRSLPATSTKKLDSNRIASAPSYKLAGTLKHAASRQDQRGPERIHGMTVIHQGQRHDQRRGEDSHHGGMGSSAPVRSPRRLLPGARDDAGRLMPSEEVLRPATGPPAVAVGTLALADGAMTLAISPEAVEDPVGVVVGLVAGRDPGAGPRR